ncbi:MAG: NAD(P)/FAD-dependent oxidoreductase [Candidatus Thermoplasmatota archaeon]|nr:NAD(P)/FAD-dependent oxidoreductase [Candidatus Thermoplasmatota archaeon]
MDDYEVLVVGGGPIGSYVAQHIAAKGWHVGLYEEHQTIGTPLHCAGLVTQRVIDLSGSPPSNIIQNSIHGAQIYSPKGTTLYVGGDRVHAIVINRRAFDEALAHRAQHAGADLLLGHQILSAKRQDHNIILDVQHNDTRHKARCCLLIGADGPASRIRTAFHFPSPKELLHGIGADVTNTNLDPTLVHIFLGSKLAPGFFAWVIPTSPTGTTARIGLCTTKHAPHPLHHYLTTLLHQPLLHHATVQQKYGGIIPLGPLKNTVADGVMLIGDAAAQVKPTSGGGLYPGLVCASHCADVANEALEQHQYTTSMLSCYHTRWTQQIGRELTAGMRFRRLFTRLTDQQFDTYVKKFNTKKTLNTINRYGDIDYPSQLLVPLLKTMPSLMSLAPVLFKRALH